MIFYAVLKPNGCIDYAGSSNHPPSGYVTLPVGLFPVHQEWLMYVDGEWQERPSLPLWERTPTGICIPNCPEELRLDVYDADSGAFLGRVIGEDVDLPDPGRYRIEASPPDPWAPIEPFIVEIE